MPRMKSLRAALILAGLASGGFAQSGERNVVVVSIDGLRWQEVFRGADDAYFKRDAKGVIDPAAKKYSAASTVARRTLLMPFLWNTVAKQGQVFGDPARQSRSHLTNGLWFSYPGYNEMLAGVADPRIDSNDKTPNPNVTVLELSLIHI